MQGDFFRGLRPFVSVQNPFFYSARNALWYAVELLGLESGDEVLLPSYNCGAEIDPFVKRGMKASLYNIHRDLSIDREDLCRKISAATKAILITHYFGFPQDIDVIRGICDNKGIFLIEDCTHAFFSTSRGKPVGSIGDISVFSLRKILPVSDGSILLCNRHTKKFTHKLKNPPISYEVGCRTRRMTLAVTGINNRGLLLGYKLFAELTGRRIKVGGRSYPSRWYSYSVDEGKLEWAMSRTSVSVLNKMQEGTMREIQIKRRRNYQALLEGTRGLMRATPVIDTLPEGACPSLFPLIVSERDRKYDLLISHGIFCSKTWPTFYPGFPWDEFPSAVFLKDHVIALPVDQDGTVKHMAKVIGLLEQ